MYQKGSAIASTNRKYLSTNNDGSQVDLWTTKDKRQRWILQDRSGVLGLPAGSGVYAIKLADESAVSTGKKFLRANPNGEGVHLWPHGGKGTRTAHWKITPHNNGEYSTIEVFDTSVLTSSPVRKFLRTNPAGTALNLATDPPLTRGRWLIEEGGCLHSTRGRARSCHHPRRCRPRRRHHRPLLPSHPPCRRPRRRAGVRHRPRRSGFHWLQCQQGALTLARLCSTAKHISAAGPNLVVHGEKLTPLAMCMILSQIRGRALHSHFPQLRMAVPSSPWGSPRGRYGGARSGTQSHMKNLQKLDVASGAWSQLPQMTHTRYYFILLHILASRSHGYIGAY